MSEQELNSYHFTSHDEPSYEMLAQIKKKVARHAKKRDEEATSTLYYRIDL